jgi:hypothetical protein
MNSYDDIPTVSQPINMKIQLFGHQLAGIYQMEKMEREQCVSKPGCIQQTKLGINAEITGFGKTLTMIGLILRDKMEWDLDTPFAHETVITESAGLIKTRKIQRYDNRLRTTLILVSQSIIKQWEDELSFTNLKVETITSIRDVETVDVESCDVILVIPSLYNRLISTYVKDAWKRFIFDEPGHLRVPGMKPVRAGFYWFVTATPNAISAKHRNCRGSFMRDVIGTNTWWDFDEQFKGMIMQNNLDFVKSSFNMPPTKHITHHCYQPVSRAVSGFVTPSIQIMIEAGNIEGAISSLGGTKTKNIVQLVKTKQLEELEEIESKIRIYTLREDEEKIEEWKDREKNIRRKIKTLDGRFQTMLSNVCNICLDPLVNPVIEPSCQNLFCGKCLLTWIHKSPKCPLCRGHIDTKNLIYIESKTLPSTISVKEPPRKQTKLEKISEIIKSNKEGKFLLFSSYDSTFDSIYNMLHESKISYAEIRGTAQLRQKNIENFKKGDIQVLFLNSTYNGAGINLQIASDIILYHEMPSITENQIIGRANRIGRMTSLLVHHLKVL